MALPIAAAAAGALAGTAYLNAKFHIWHDLTAGGLDAKGAEKFIIDRVTKKRLLTYHMFEEQAAKQPDNLFLIFEGRQWTYAEFLRCLNRAGNWLMNDLGVKKGEIVALDGENSAEYLMLWFAIDGIGACTAFINNNLTGPGLEHCIKLADARYVLVQKEILPLVEPSGDELQKHGTSIVPYDQAFLESLSDATPIPESRREDMQPEDLRSLIYTSGTTGLPKAVAMNTGREMLVGYLTSRYLRLKPSDRFYTCMPLYHGAAHGLCTTPSIHAGSTMVLGRKFSHKRFWPEVRESKANIIQYVGELCRYLMNAPPSPLDTQHNVQMAWGNGMRPDIWEPFRQRFNIPIINELYAATDGMGATFNENRGEFGRNAIAIRGLIWRLTQGKNQVIVKTDYDTGDIMRDKNDFAIPAGIDEPGEVIHALDPETADQQVSGYYKNQAAAEKRRMRDVFRKGDMWFRSGDAMRTDRDGRVYFVDRLGDTFRWKSENVSTNEVSDVLGKHPQIAEANVYGVSVPRADGRCGCGAIVMAEGLPESSIDWADIAKHCLERLPRYAVPIFLRLTPRLEYTGTLKLQKVKLRNEGVDVEKVEAAGDRMYWLPPGGSAYVPFKRKDLESLKVGAVRL